MTRTSFSTAAFTQLISRLSHTNARYAKLASQIRCRVRHTDRLRRRASQAGLRIDTSKARACPEKYISTQPPPVLDRSPDCIPVMDDSSQLGAPARAHMNTHIADSEPAAWFRMEGNTPRDAYMRDLRLPQLRNLPETVRRCRRRRGSEGRQRIMLRLPPLRLHLNVDYQCCDAAEAPFQCQGPVPMPGAPRLTPRQLPDDECGADVFESSTLFMDAANSDPSMPPIGLRVYSGLCITIPPRNLKRKLQDVEEEEGAALSHQPKRFLKPGLDESQYQ